MKLNYVNIAELKSPSSGSKRRNNDVMLIKIIKNNLINLEDDVFEYFVSKYEIPNHLTKEDKIDYLAENYSSLIEKDFLILKRDYYESKNILLEEKLINLDKFTLGVLFFKFKFPSKITKSDSKIKYILEEFPYEKIEEYILISEKEGLKIKKEEDERKEKSTELQCQLDQMDEESLNYLYKKFHISPHLNRATKKISLLFENPDLILNEINNFKKIQSDEMVLRKQLNSLNDEDINKLFDIFFDFGDFLDRKNKIYSLSKCDIDRIYEEINNLDMCD